MGIILHPSAQEELRDGSRCYAAQTEAAAWGFIDEVDRAMGLIAEAPGRWPAVWRGVRRFLLRRFPYAIYYEPLISGDVLILAIAHTSRRPGYWRHRT